MENAFVSWRDYEGLDGFGTATQQEVTELRKALEAGSDLNNPGTGAGVGFPLRIESLERTLKVVTYRLDDVRLWRAIPKLPAFNTVEEFNKLQSYSDNDVGGFIAEGDLPEEESATYSREYTVIKFAGVRRRVTHVMTLVKSAME